MPVDELHRHRAFSYGSRAPLDGAGARVASNEDSRHACPEYLGGGDLVPGEDEAVVGAGDHVAEPVGVWPRAEETKHEGERELLAVGERHRVDMAVGSMELCDLTMVADNDARPFEFVNEIGG